MWEKHYDEKHIKENCKGLLIDLPSPLGGTTNTGNTAMRFFSPENREAISTLIPGDETRQNLKGMLYNSNEISNIIQ